MAAGASARQFSGRTALFAAALVALLAAWMPTSYSMVRRWMSAQGYYSHGLLIPLISVYLIWLRRDDLGRATVRRGAWGLLPMGLGVMGQVASAYANVAFSSGFSMLLILVGLVWFVYGPAVLRIVAFPLCFLAFMVPLYMELLEQVSFPMKTGAAAAATYVLREVVGLQCDRVGNTIHFLHTQLEVGDPCSGLRSLISLTALGALVAYMARMSLWRRLVLFVASVPFALAANVVRITVLGMVGYRWGAEAANGDLVHYGTGFLVFFVAVVLLLGLWRLLRIGQRAPRPQAPGPWPEALRRTAQVLLVLAAAKALVTMFVLEGVADRYVTPEHVAAVRGMDLAALPDEEHARALEDLRAGLADYREPIRLQRFARATIDVNYVFFTLVGLVFLVRGFRWTRRYLQGLAVAGLAADAGFVLWLLRVERIPVAPASAGLAPLAVSLHLALYAGLSAVTLLWTLNRLSDRALRASLGAAEAFEAPSRGFRARAAFGVVLTGGLAALTWWLLRPAPVEAGLIRARGVPRQIDFWVGGEDLEPEPVVVETLETRDILTRLYRRPGSPVNVQLSVVFSQQNRRATHPPEICLKGSGWETDYRARVTLDVPRRERSTTPFVELISRRGSQERLVTFYTFKAGPRYTNRYLRQQLDIFLLNLAGRPARGALVRFSASAAPGDVQDVRGAVIEFMREAMRRIESALEALPDEQAPSPGEP